MKELRLYQCEICGTSFSNKDKAKECENTHKKITKVVPAKYRPYTSAKDGIPDIIAVEFNDGSIIKYKR